MAVRRVPGSGMLGDDLTGTEPAPKRSGFIAGFPKVESKASTHSQNTKRTMPPARGRMPTVTHHKAHVYLYIIIVECLWTMVTGWMSRDIGGRGRVGGPLGGGRSFGDNTPTQIFCIF